MISLTPLTNFNSAVPWGLWVSIYVWLVGISAGCFALVVWGNLKNNPYLIKITKMAILFSLSTLLAGLLSILVDLGHIERFYGLFISPNPTSVMAWMVWLYGVYFLILVIALQGVKKEFNKVTLRFAFLFAVAIIVVESLLFAMPPGKSWHSLSFPIHFITSSFVSGISALIFIVGILWVKNEKLKLLKALSKVAVPIIIINLLVEIIELFSAGNLNHINKESWVLLLGQSIAIFLLLTHNSKTITFAGCLGFIAIWLAKYNSLISAQIVEPFKGFSSSYIEPRLEFSYNPNIFESLVAIFLIGLVAGLFYFFYKVFPLTREE